jgi:DNA (cytosine-5)-methyltransferase 1
MSSPQSPLNFLEARNDAVYASRMKIVGLFAGIGGFELGLMKAGHDSELLCEIDEHARSVLHARFPGVLLKPDVREMKRLPSDVEILTAGFPCQDLSQAGGTAGITGSRSGLVGEVFRLLKKSRPRWVLLENVSFMLRLNKGAAMTLITHELEKLGYHWAYRVVDSRSFGVPHRRKRVFLVASLDSDPSLVLMADEAGESTQSHSKDVACGFYWTEGNTGLGWAVDAVPPLKGGSSFGIPSPPAIWIPGKGIVTPDIRDAERLQGLESGWTEPAELVGETRHRWKLVGNAVTAPAATWIGRRISKPGERIVGKLCALDTAGGWPNAAFSFDGSRKAVAISQFPERSIWPGLGSFLRFPTKPLSCKAASGFKKRLFASGLNYPRAFGTALEKHVISFASTVRPEI